MGIMNFLQKFSLYTGCSRKKTHKVLHMISLKLFAV